ncbi:MAG TPA: carboxypeptidase-like regulatory domain-containing protein, partial [Ignavibacteria bacterium]|nr:carboxypeptidase-like regulatory domain-containing protein [Ignavibacteria bacterium]
MLSQSYRLSGKITDAKNNRPIEYVTVKVADSTYGTTADRYGNYFLELHPGSNTLIFSLIGYYSDTVNVFIENSNITRDVVLKPSEILTETIVVLGEDPAYDIIRKAIKYKKLFRSSLKEYDYDAYTKY